MSHLEIMRLWVHGHYNEVTKQMRKMNKSQMVRFIEYLYFHSGESKEAERLLQQIFTENKL